ncbi:MAPEG family protein [Jannaschia sp. S6380]|uniref:MAPEG family protein n=1 Tax=Jannaschia sp. S6380 TaxID=2926408 RepID=UPI001FF29BCC|nr:MAPEG family protein [Jannaschia sp. S6380]MCK0167850.1 MAPEG family protein [Jannaschia sp. S6380]
MPEVTPFYAAIIAILMAVLSTLVGVGRGHHGVALGDGRVAPLALSIRRFGNLSEYAAMALLILLLLELTGTEPFWLHAYGTALVAFRAIHPIVLFDDMGAPAWRKAGRFASAAGTAGLLLSGGVALLL